MGGGGSITKPLEEAVKDSVKTVTGGVYDPRTGGLTLDPEKMGKNVIDGATYAGAQQAVMGKPPELPKVEDPGEQARRAEAAAKAKVAKELGQKGRGLSSTILGGGISEDTSVLKKKRLLGE